MCQTILNNQTNIIQTQSTPATQQLGRESTRRERKCNLIDWRRNIVATGRVIEMEGQTVHGIPLSDEDCRVILDAINQPNTPLSISTSFAETLGDVGVGGHTTWPKAFI
ncbi:Transposase [Macleaya cordata]|uniref:Transposase n=1 Tax=Macleaya cordata TaxID=56857 RepID=A0A200PZN9_MACCD|nr:Transposase [Macleaya cordata]